MDYRLDTEIFSKVDALLDKIKKNRELQQMALDNGIDIKNSVLLTDETENNYAIAAIALMLAKRADDSRYKDLVRYGMDHRTTKMDIINDYKDQANQMLAKYRQCQDVSNAVSVNITNVTESANEKEPDSIVFFGKSFNVTIEFRTYGESKSDKCEKSYLKYKAEKESLIKKVEEACEDFIKKNKSWILDEVDSKDVKDAINNLSYIKLLKPKQIIFHQDGEAGIFFDCKWDDEHGFIVQFLPKVKPVDDSWL